MPAWLKGKDAEKAWQWAKGKVREQYPKIDSEKDSDRFYKLVTTLYKNRCTNPDYECEPKNEETVMSKIDWKKAAEILVKPELGEDMFGMKTEAKDLEKGQNVLVLSKIGRTVGSGVVETVTDEMVSIRSSNGVDQLREYATSLYDFAVMQANEAGEPNLDEASTQVPDPGRQADSGPLPVTAGSRELRAGVKVLLKLFKNDRMWSEQIWTDIKTHGIDRAAKKHGLTADKKKNVQRQLRLAGAI